MGELKMTFLWSAFHSSLLNFFEQLSGHMRKEESSPEHSLSYIILSHPIPAICFLKYKIAAFQGLEFTAVCNVLWKRWSTCMENLFPMNSNCCYNQPWAAACICTLNLHDSLGHLVGRDVCADCQQHWGWAGLQFRCLLSLPHLLLAVCFTSGFSRSRNVSVLLFVFVCRGLLWHWSPPHSSAQTRINQKS